MKYWCTTVYDQNHPTGWHPKADSDGGHVETLSEDEILEEYYSYWSGKMIKKYGQEEFDKTYSKMDWDCIDDWVVVNWAWESK